MEMLRNRTKEIRIGNVWIGGSHPVAIQSMTNTKTEDVAATVEQILALEEAGCEIIRCAVPTMEAALALKEIKKQIHIPLVADIHFDYRLAIAAIENGADKIRINPGNIGSKERVQAVVEKAKEYNVPIRVGVNSGSLEKNLLEKYGGVTAEGIVESALDKVRMIEEMGYDNLVVSIKSSDVLMCVRAHELIAEKCQYPLHVGITESGTVYSGNIKSSVGLGIILHEGIGNTIRVSLTGDPTEEIRTAKLILKTLGMRKGGIEVVSCPTCGRTRIDLIALANQVEKMVQDIDLDIKVAVMGCVVNGQLEQVKNEKTFFEVFPTLRADGELKMLFQDVEVKKITTNSTREFLHIHMVSHHLIPKKVIWKMEQSIKEQLFGTASVAIQIEEFYVLSELYTLETLLAEYKESLVLELEKKSVLAASMFEQAELHFEGEKIVCVELLDSIVSEGKKEYIVTLLEEVLSRRFGMQAEIRVLYREQEENQSREYDEQRIQQEINAIFERRARQKGEILQKPISERQTDSAKEKKTADSGKKESAKSGFKKGEFRKKEFQRPLKQGDDPSLVYGKNFEDEPLTLDQVVTEMGEITIHGKIISFDTREIRNEKTILMFSVTDFTDTITVKMFVRNDQLAELLGDIKKGAFVKIKGVTTIDKFDGELTIGSVTGIKKIGDFTVSREDLSPVKRVELHCHTKMSDMDGVSEVKSIVKRAHDWGHPAIAITDHGVAQSFPDANHYIETLDKDDPFKVIYGVEGYVVDDLTEIAVNAGEQTLDDTYIVGRWCSCGAQCRV